MLLTLETPQGRLLGGIHPKATIQSVPYKIMISFAEVQCKARVTNPSPVVVSGLDNYLHFLRFYLFYQMTVMG